MSIVASKAAKLGRYTGHNPIDDSYRAIRFHLQAARRWATALRFCHYKRGTKKQYAFLTAALLDSLEKAAWWKEHLRFWRRLVASGYRLPAFPLGHFVRSVIQSDALTHTERKGSCHE